MVQVVEFLLEKEVLYEDDFLKILGECLFKLVEMINYDWFKFGFEKCDKEEFIIMVKYVVDEGVFLLIVL